MKGEICIGPECDREQMMTLDVCKTHRVQQHRGLDLWPLGKRRPKTVIKDECSFTGCDRPRTGKKVLCKAHNHQEYTGKVLMPLGEYRRKRKPVVLKLKGKTMNAICSFLDCGRKPTGLHGLCYTHRKQHLNGLELSPIKTKAVYEPNAKCRFKTCDKKIVTDRLCNTHYCQQKNGKALTSIKTRDERAAMRKGFSETKICDTCEEEKNWRLFVTGLHKDKNECHDCYRHRILAVPEKKPSGTLEDLINQIDLM